MWILCLCATLCFIPSYNAKETHSVQRLFDGDNGVVKSEKSFQDTSEEAQSKDVPSSNHDLRILTLNLRGRVIPGRRIVTNIDGILRRLRHRLNEQITRELQAQARRQRISSKLPNGRQRPMTVLPTISLSESDIENAVIAAIIESSTATSRKRGSLRRTHKPNDAITSTITAPTPQRRRQEAPVKRPAMRSTSTKATTSATIAPSSFRINSNRRHVKNNQNRDLHRKALTGALSARDEFSAKSKNLNGNDISSNDTLEIDSVPDDMQKSTTILPKFIVTPVFRHIPMSSMMASIMDTNVGASTDSSLSNLPSVNTTSLPENSPKFLAERDLEKVFESSMRITKVVPGNVGNSDEFSSSTTTDLLVLPNENVITKQFRKEENEMHEVLTAETGVSSSSIAPISRNNRDAPLAKNNSITDIFDIARKSIETTTLTSSSDTIEAGSETSPLMVSITDATTKSQLTKEDFATFNGLSDEDPGKTATVGLPPTLAPPVGNFALPSLTQDIGAPGSAPPNDFIVEELNKADNFMEVARRLNVFRDRITVQRRIRRRSQFLF